jgi:hypothetical protein
VQGQLPRQAPARPWLRPIATQRNVRSAALLDMHNRHHRGGG